MPYKIVQTLEKGRPVLTAVPDGWEMNGILFWPKKHEKLRRIENSKPESNWQSINCILKRSNLLSFSQAEHEIDDMSNASDTETDNDNISHTRKHNKMNNTSKFQQVFNDMARQFCEEDQPQLLSKSLMLKDAKYHDPSKENVILVNPAPLHYTITGHAEERDTTMLTCQNHTLTENINQETSVIISQDYDMFSEEPTGIRNLNSTAQVFMPNNSTLPTPLAPTTPDRTVTDVISIDDAMTLILQKLDCMKQDINKLFENQKKILFKLTETNTQFEEFIKASSNQTTRRHESIPAIKPVSNLKELQNLECILTDPDVKARLKNKIEVLCSKGKGRGTNNAYNLIDVLFQRNFLCQCSWAGGSKTGSSKICLKSFTNVFDLFFSAINESDPNFKKPDCEKFLKTVLKNSRQRLASKQIRMSTTRCRQKVKTVTKAVLTETLKVPASTTVCENYTIAVVNETPEMPAGTSACKSNNIAVVAETPEVPAGTSACKSNNIAVVIETPEMSDGSSVGENSNINQDQETETDYLL